MIVNLSQILFAVLEFDAMFALERIVSKLYFWDSECVLVTIAICHNYRCIKYK